MIRGKSGFVGGLGLYTALVLFLVFTISTPSAQAVLGGLEMTIGNVTLVSKTRVDRTIYEFTYKADIVSREAINYTNVRATLVSYSANTAVTDGVLNFGAVAAGTTVNSSDTFSFRQDRTYVFNPDDLHWTIAGDAQTVQDSDGDGVADSADQCPGYDDTLDVDNDGIPDGCDTLVDSDNDGIADSADRCPGVDDRIDVDQDGTPDCIDTLIDSDNDGVADSADRCPGVDDRIDVDNDNIPDCIDTLIDSDGDGVADDADQCPNADDRIDLDGDSVPDCIDPAIYTLTGTVLGSGRPLADAVVKIGTDKVENTTDSAGKFTVHLGTSDLISDGISQFFPVNVTASGYASGHAKVVKNASDVAYSVEINLIPTSDEIEDTDDVTAGVEIDHEGEKVGELTIPETSLPTGATGVTGSVTYIDPTTTDMDAIPGGDLLAVREGQDPNEGTVTLESYGMMEFDLVDQNGQQVTDLNGPAEVCMKVPESMSVSVGTVIPLWYYDTETGLWVEEGSGTVQDRGNDGFWMCGNVSHFTWWNYDEPVETHSCFKFQFVDEATGATIDDLDWYADGVTYNGESPARDCNCDSDDPGLVCPNKPMDSFTVKVSTSVDNPEQIRVYALYAGVRYYLVRDSNGNGTYSLSTNVADATIFNNPTEAASCLYNTNVNQCHFLDEGDEVTGSGLAADGNNGLLPLRTFNRAPTISSLTAESFSILLGESTNLTAVVTDPEGDTFNVSWSATCWSAFDEELIVTGGSGDNYMATFNAPSAIGNLPGVYCNVNLKATDANGNTSNASQRIVVRDVDTFNSVEGVLYGTDGNPLADHPLHLIGYDSTYENVVYDRFVNTDQDGHYIFENIPYCEVYYGEILVDFTYDDPNNPDDLPVQWESYVPISLNCAENITVESELTASATPAGETKCQQDIYLPTLWGSVQGTYYGADGVPTNGGPIYIGSSDSQYQLGYVHFYTTQPVIMNSQGEYGPVSVPLGDNWLEIPDSEQSLVIGEILYRGQTKIEDLGPGVFGTINGTVFDSNGMPVPEGVEVKLSDYYGTTENNSTTITDANGQYSFPNKPKSRYYVSAGYYSVGEINFYGETVVVNINELGCTIIGTVYDRSGQPYIISENELSLNNFSAINQSFLTSTNSSGSFSFTNVRSGTIQFTTSFDELEGSRYFYVPSCSTPTHVDLQVFPVQNGCTYNGQ